MKENNWLRHVEAEGRSRDLCVRNIITHLDAALTDAQKDEINWHPDQSVSVAVLRIIDRWQERQRESDAAKAEAVLAFTLSENDVRLSMRAMTFCREQGWSLPAAERTQP